MAQELIDRLNASGKLPTPPGVVLKILDLTSNADTTVGELTDVIALDPGLSAKILRFVNSPMSGMSREVTSLRQAVAAMGTRGVKMMALSFSLVSSSKGNKCVGYDAEHFSVHAAACAAAAKVLAGITKATNAQDAFSAGLLCQLGRSILASSLPKEYAAIISRADRIPADLPPLERAALGESYATVGGAVLSSWKLPASLCAAVSQFRDPPASDVPALANVLSLAEKAADFVCPDRADRHADPGEYLEYARETFQLPAESALHALSLIAAEVDGIRRVLEVPKSTLRAPEDIESEVRERIAELSLAMHLDNQNMAIHQEELMRRATTDALTGVGNRAAFDARLELELERALRESGPLTLLMMDVDHFKKFNDTFGHQVGDHVLQAVARALDDSVRKVDFVARYGGEEFAVIAPMTSADQAMQLAERLRKSVAAASVPSDKGALSVTVSIGVAVLHDVNEPPKDAPRLVKTADELLYKAKLNGRNRVELADPGRLVAAR